jgi:hypothetical protein
MGPSSEVIYRFKAGSRVRRNCIWLPRKSAAICDEAKLAAKVDAQRAVIKGIFVWKKTTRDPLLHLDLLNASAAALFDDDSWPEQDKVRLDGFEYGRITSPDRNAHSRLRWIALQKQFAPQPYRRLAKVLRDEGDDAGARRVLYADDANKKTLQLRDFETSFSNIHPDRSLGWLMLLVVVWFFVYRSAYNQASFTPTDKEAFDFFAANHRPPEYYPNFHASVYSLENSFPLVKLGQVDRWQPKPNPATDTGSSRHRQLLTSPRFLLWFSRIQILLGWFFATMGIAGVTGIVRKD